MRIIIVIVCLSLYCTDISADAEFENRCNVPGPSRETADENIHLLLYTRNHLFTPIELESGNRSVRFDTAFNSENPTVLYIHGFTQDALCKSSQQVKDAYMMCGPYNILMVDWGKFGIYPHYNRAVNMLPMIGRHVAQMIKHLVEKRMISLPNLHVIGTSLGAHISGIVGEELDKLGLEKIGRITGLDPAGPLFEKRTTLDGMLDEGDATFVDIIHTDTRILGIKRPIGHADFYVNGGRSQPGCGSRYQLSKGTKALVACSHRRAREYYIESILNPHGFPALKCKSFSAIHDICQEYGGDIMGFGTNPGTRGIFSVKTRLNYPFATHTSSFSKVSPCGIIPQEHINSNDYPLSNVFPVSEKPLENL